jgi:membrane associated rhomboid family serine protease
MGTVLIFLINAAVFWYININHSDVSGLYMQHYGITYDNYDNPVVWITNAFIHGGWGHIIMNMMALLEIGFATEKVTNTFWFFAVYAISLLGADIASVYYVQEHFNVYVIGASGAIFGLYAFYSLITKEFKDFIIFALIYNGAVYLMDMNIAWFGHAGGALAGFIAGIIFLLFNRGFVNKETLQLTSGEKEG